MPSHIHVHIPGSKHGVQVHSHTRHRIHREHRTLVQPQRRAFHIHRCHSQDHIHGRNQDVHNHVLKNTCCVQDHIHREHQPQPQQHAFHIHKCHSQDHIHDHSQEKSSQDVHSHVPKNKCGAQDHIHREHRPQLLAQHQHHAFHLHNIHDHIHGHNQEKSILDFHNHKHGVQDHIHNIHGHNHDHSPEKSIQDVVHHSQDDDQHSHTEGQHQQQPELLCKPGELS